MAIIVKEAKAISDLEVIFLVSHWTEEYFKSESWTKGARKVLYKRYEEIMRPKKEGGINGSN